MRLGVFVLCIGAGVVAASPVGHLKPLGAHRPPENYIPIETGFPPPKRFFEEYVSQSRPVIMRGAADGWPARWKWTDDYLRRMIGEKEVEM